MIDLGPLASAIETRAWREAREQAMTAWRVCRASSLGDLVDVLARKARTEPVLPMHRTWRAWDKHLASLVERPGDPRIGKGIAELLVDAPKVIDGYLDRTLLTFATQASFLAHADARSIPLLQATPTDNHSSRSWLLVRTAACRARLLAKLEPLLAELPALPPDDDARVRAWVASLDGEDTDVTALFAAVYADPDDDAARAVLADALEERDDPRGRYINLALRGEDAADLLGTYEKEWLGPLVDVLANREWRHGFLQHARPVGKLDADVRLSTLRSLAQGASTAADFVDAVAACPHVRRLVNDDHLAPTSLLLAELVRRPQPGIDELVLRGFTSVTTLDDEVRIALPGLRRLGFGAVPVEGAAVLARWCGSSGLQAVDLDARETYDVDGDVHDFLGALARETQVQTFSLTTRVARVQVTRTPGGFVVESEGDATDLVATVPDIVRHDVASPPKRRRKR